MKANDKETQAFSDAIDQMNGGLEKIVDFYNELEEERPSVTFNEEALQAIEQAKEQYGTDYVNKKINTVVLELLSWLPPDEKGKKKQK